MTQPQIIYFAHPYSIYDTELERQLLEKIEKRYPGAEIINSKDIKVDNPVRWSTDPKAFRKVIKKHFFPLVAKCNVFAYFGDIWGPGVEMELKEARRLNKIIEEITNPEIDAFLEQLEQKRKGGKS